MTRYEWALGEENKWRKIAHDAKDAITAEMASHVYGAIRTYYYTMSSEEAAEIMPEEDAE